MFLRILSIIRNPFKPYNSFSDVYLNINNLAKIMVNGNVITFHMSNMDIHYLTGDNKEETDATMKMIMKYVDTHQSDRQPYIELNDITHYNRPHVKEMK